MEIWLITPPENNNNNTMAKNNNNRLVCHMLHGLPKYACMFYDSETLRIVK